MTIQVQTELDRVMRRGRRVFQPCFVLYYLPLPTSPKPRIVVSSKVDKRSAVRHKVKRRVRHILAKHNLQGFGMVFLMNKSSITEPFAKLSGSIGYALHQIR